MTAKKKNSLIYHVQFSLKSSDEDGLCFISTLNSGDIINVLDLNFLKKKTYSILTTFVVLRRIPYFFKSTTFSISSLLRFISAS